MLRQYVSAVLTNVVGIGVCHRFARIYYNHRQGSQRSSVFVRNAGIPYDSTVLFYNLQTPSPNFNGLKNLILQSNSVITP